MPSSPITSKLLNLIIDSGRAPVMLRNVDAYLYFHTRGKFKSLQHYIDSATPQDITEHGHAIESAIGYLESKDLNNLEVPAAPPTQPGDKIPLGVLMMQKKDGIYLLREPNNPEMVMIASVSGKLFKLKADKEIGPGEFVHGTMVAGPFRI